ncbi:uncharacterized protein LOC129718600 isoform X2 [Wyeomyia smithii]|uniref:uncharacterized protein LOC129718600 isoform X2 n=1 Tax=Wyeomyia smithii TaxID=174621 RepID=UPI0024681C09|nr:uncharacterized protein LOC129718600 isoform X2 [Wyeomyia smithii]
MDFKSRESDSILDSIILVRKLIVPPNNVGSTSEDEFKNPNRYTLIVHRKVKCDQENQSITANSTGSRRSKRKRKRSRSSRRSAAKANNMPGKLESDAQANRVESVNSMKTAQFESSPTEQSGAARCRPRPEVKPIRQEALKVTEQSKPKKLRVVVSLYRTQAGIWNSVSEINTTTPASAISYETDSDSDSEPDSPNDQNKQIMTPRRSQKSHKEKGVDFSEECQPSSSGVGLYHTKSMSSVSEINSGTPTSTIGYETDSDSDSESDSSIDQNKQIMTPRRNQNPHTEKLDFLKECQPSGSGVGLNTSPSTSATVSHKAESFQNKRTMTPRRDQKPHTKARDTGRKLDLSKASESNSEALGVIFGLYHTESEIWNAVSRSDFSTPTSVDNAQIMMPRRDQKSHTDALGTKRKLNVSEESELSSSVVGVRYKRTKSMTSNSVSEIDFSTNTSTISQLPESLFAENKQTIKKTKARGKERKQAFNDKLLHCTSQHSSSGVPLYRTKSMIWNSVSEIDSSECHHSNGSA